MSEQYLQEQSQLSKRSLCLSNAGFIIQMNIFELILSDPSAYHQISQDYSNHSSNWKQFKQSMNLLFSSQTPEIETFILRNKQLWAHTFKTSPQLLPVMKQYYLNQLQTLVENVLEGSLREIALTLGANSNYIEMELTSYLQTISQYYHVHEKYLRIFDQEHRYLNIFRNKIQNLMNKFDIKNKIQSLLKKCYAKNSLNILKSDILEFQEDVMEFVREKCAEGQQFTFQPSKVKLIFQRLFSLGFAEEYFEDFFDYLNKQAETFLINCTSFTEGKDFLTKCLNFQRSFQKNFIKNIKSQVTEQLFTRYIKLMDDNIYFICSKHCSKHILDIILDFPDSLNVILSLKKCLDKAPLLSEVGEYLNRQVEKRLLIPGVITQSILNQYINMLKVLQILDPQGMIFEKITVPIKNYLLKRNDTLRCIISHLTDDIENYSKLTREVVKIPSKQYIEEMSSEEDENAAKEWQVLPLKEQKIKRRVKYQEIDLVTVLVGLYGSQEAFIGQYQSMMAEKLMSVKNYNIDEEIRNIQLLKMRFGESALQNCNIIVKDVKDSKRNDTIIHSKKSENKPGLLSLNELNCLVVSKGYWPINYQNTSSFNLPNEVKQVFEEYSKRFSQTKAMRKIYFHSNFGHVNITLSFDNGDFQFKCLPIQAVMISFFDQNRIRDALNGLSSQQLSNQLQIPQNIIKQKMSFWVHKGVVKETRAPKHGLSLRRMASAVEDSEVISYKPVKVYQHIIKDEIDDDFQTELLKESTSMQSHLRHIIEGLILSILNTNGPKSLEKIHLLLKTVYKTDLDYTYGETQTSEILKKMVQKKKIKFNGEVYSSKQE